MLLKCKPCYNFQSVEFDWNCENDKDLDLMFKFYDQVIKGLAEIAPEQPDKVRKQSTPKVELATPGQIAILESYSIPYTKQTTKDEASKLIKENMIKYEELRGK